MVAQEFHLITASIIILCHNDFDFLLQSLHSVILHTRSPYELILVDNATRDEGRPFLKSLHDAKGMGRKWALLRKELGMGTGRPGPKDLADIKVIRNSKNRFFSAGNNQGIRVSQGENIVLLNADTWVGPDWLTNLLECLRRDPGAGLAGPCTNSSVGWQFIRGVPEMGMKEFSRFARTWQKRHLRKSRPVHRLAAFCWLIPGRVIREVGVLDARFGPGGSEDWDYCMRLLSAGYRILLAEDVFVYHHGGRGYVNMDYRSMLERNHWILIDKYSAEMRARIPAPQALCEL